MSDLTDIQKKYHYRFQALMTEMVREVNAAIAADPVHSIDIAIETNTVTRRTTKRVEAVLLVDAGLAFTIRYAEKYT